MVIGWFTRDQLIGTCAIPPSPEVREAWRRSLDGAREVAAEDGGPGLRLTGDPQRLGLNDGVIAPPESYAVGTPMMQIRSAAADRAPLRGTVRVVVVLVDFSDKAMTQTAAHFNDLFFSTVSSPRGASASTTRRSTTGSSSSRARSWALPHAQHARPLCEQQLGAGGRTERPEDMARDAVVSRRSAVNFGPFDNDGNGFVDAFIVIHAGPGGEVTGSKGDIWSHKWVLSGPRTPRTGSRSTATSRARGLEDRRLRP